MASEDELTAQRKRVDDLRAAVEQQKAEAVEAERARERDAQIAQLKIEEAHLQTDLDLLKADTERAAKVAEAEQAEAEQAAAAAVNPEGDAAKGDGPGMADKHRELYKELYKDDSDADGDDDESDSSSETTPDPTTTEDVKTGRAGVQEDEDANHSPDLDPEAVPDGAEPVGATAPESTDFQPTFGSDDDQEGR